VALLLKFIIIEVPYVVFKISKYLENDWCFDLSLEPIFCKFKLWCVLWVCVYSWLVCAPKMFQLNITNLLFGLCRSVWIIDLLVILSNPHPGALAHPFTPKCCELENIP
jgi:hypothetical protein